MGFFSNLFKKKVEDQPTPVTVGITVKTEVVAPNLDIPPLQDNYAKAIFLWANSKVSPIKETDSYARYFLYECGIRDTAAYHRELIAAGYFEEASVEQSLNSLKVTELKEILATLGQSTTGKKDALIWRVANNVDDSLLAHYCPKKMYVLSEKGQAFLQEHEDYVMVHKHKNWGIGWKEYDAHKTPGKSYYDTMWSIFNEQLSNDPHHCGRSTYLFMCQLAHEEGNRAYALQMLLHVLYIDLSGVEGTVWYDMYRQGIYKEKELRECFNIAIMLAPGIVEPIEDFADIYSDDLVDMLYEQTLPVQVCEKKLFLSIVHSALDGTYDQETAEEKLKRAYYKYLRENIFQ